MSPGKYVNYTPRMELPYDETIIKKVFMDCKQYALISIMNLVSEICGMCFFEGITVDKHSRQLDSFLNIE